jgi:hypothetical protein
LSELWGGTLVSESKVVKVSSMSASLGIRASHV